MEPSKKTKKPVKVNLINEIKKRGFPVISLFDHADASAMIYAKSESDVYFGDAYGDHFIKPGAKEPYSLKDVDEEGLFRLYHDGLIPGDEYYESTVKIAEEEITGISEPEPKEKEGNGCCSVCGERISCDVNITLNLYNCDVCRKPVCLKCSKQFPNAHARSICNTCDAKKPELAIMLGRKTRLAAAMSELTNLSIILDIEYEHTKNGRKVDQ
jgi:hypothetical protein